MIRKYVGYFSVLVILSLSLQNCSTDSQKKKNNNGSNNQNSITESFRRTGWIKENQYRAVIFIITDEECRNSSPAEIEQKIKNTAYKNLQKELNPLLNRNASIQIKLLVDNFGTMIKAEAECINSNMYFYDLKKKDLKADFEKIKNLK